MLRTNSIKARKNIRDWIVDSVDEFRLQEVMGDSVTVEKLNFTQLADFVMNVFRDEKGWEIPRMGEFGAFEDWTQGLPGALCCDYHWSVCAVDILGDILEETEQERDKYTEMQAEHMLTQLIYRELTTNKNKKV